MSHLNPTFSQAFFDQLGSSPDPYSLLSEEEKVVYFEAAKSRDAEWKAKQVLEIQQTPLSSEQIVASGEAQLDQDGRVQDLRGPDGRVEDLRDPDGKVEDLSLASVLEPPREENELSSIVSSVRTRMLNDDAKELAMRLAMIKQSINPSNLPGESYRTALEEVRRSSSVEDLFERYQSEYGMEQSASVIEGALEQASNGLATTDTSADIIDNALDLKEQYSGRVGEERIIAEAFAPLSMEEKVLNNIVATNFAKKLTQDWAETRGGVDKFFDLAGLFLVPDFFKDATDLLEVGIFNTKSKMVNFIFNYQLLDPEDKIEVFPGILEELKEAYDNNGYKVIRIVAMMHSVSPGKDFTIGVIGDIVDIGLSATLTGAIGVGKNIVSVKRLQRKLTDMDAPKDAASLSGVSVDKTISSPAQTVVGTQIDDAITASAFNMEDNIVGIGSTDGLSADIIKQRDKLTEEILIDIEEGIIQPFAAVRQRDKVLQVESLNDLDKDVRIAESMRYVTDAFENNSDILIKNIEEISRTETGFLLRYDMVDDSGKLTGSQQEFFWRKTDNGSFIPESKDFDKKNKFYNNIVASKLFSPLVKLFNVDPSILNNTTLGGLQASILKNQLAKIAKDLDKGLSISTRKDINSILIVGDEIPGGKVFSVAELKIGVATARGDIVLDNPEHIKNYYKKVSYNEELWNLRNHTIRQHLLFEDGMELNYLREGKAVKLIVLRKKDFRGFSPDKGELILAPQLSKNGYLDAGNLNISAYTEKGFVPVKIVDEYKAGGKHVRWAIVKDTGNKGGAHFKQLPRHVLNKTPGYVPRIYEPGYYFVKDTITGSTIRAFSSQKQAIAWKTSEQIVQDNLRDAQKLLNREGTPTEIDPRVNYQEFSDRELTKYQSLIEDSNAYGGTYLSPRKSTPLVLDEDGKKLVRLSWGDAIQRNIDSIAEIMPLNLYRLSLKEKWKNTVDKIAKNEGKDTGLNFNDDWKTTTLPNISDSTTRRMLLDTRDYLLDQNKVWGQDERIWNKVMMSIIETMGFQGKTARFAIKNIASQSPLDSMHRLAFGLHLGWFNPRQLYVQAQNATLAISMHPLHGVRSVNEAMMMRTAIYASDKNMEGVLRGIGKVGDISGIDLLEDINHFKRSGLLDGILRVADSDAAIEGLVPGTLNSFRNLSRKGLIFYEEGELFSRLVAFNIAKNRWRTANKGKSIDDNSLKEIITDTFRMHMNLQKENAAWWQQAPLVKNASQFQQVQAKLAENLMLALLSPKGTKGVWTRKEAARVAAGQLAFYGTLGVPIAGGITSWMIDKSGTDPVTFQKENPNFAELVTDGINGWMFGVLGFDNQFGGDTASLFAAADENLIFSLYKMAMNTEPFSQDTPTELALGPAANILVRQADFAINVWNSIKVLVAKPTVETAVNGLLIGLDDWAAFTSTWSKTRKLRWMIQNDKLWTTSGKTLLSKEALDNINLRSKVMMALGIPLQAEAAYWALSKEDRSNAQDLADVKKDFRKLLFEFSKTKDMDRFLILKADLLGGGQWSEQEVDEIIKEGFSNVFDGKDLISEQIRKHLIALAKAGGRTKNELVPSAALIGLTKGKKVPDDDEQLNKEEED